jgi:hypothetical protein
MTRIRDLHVSRRAVLFVGSMLLLAACGGGAATPTSVPVATVAPTATTAAATSVPTATSAPTPTSAPTATPVPAIITADPISGAPALGRGSLAARPIVVMFDNHPNAYPQTGLDQAAVVFEALAEFGLTRFMAVYRPDALPDAQVVGPVRSSRLYFVQWAMGLQGMYVHAGGSPQALETLASTDEVFDVDALMAAGSAYFTRNDEREAPHNLYTTGEALKRALGEATTSDALADVGFSFKADAAEADRPAAQRIDYFFLYREDSAGWVYDPATNSYGRLRRGEPALDLGTGQQLRAKNVVVMEVFEQPIPGDEKGRIEQQVIGEGRARVFMDGVEREVTWRKPDATSQLAFFDPSGEEVAFNPGVTWLVALPAIENLTVQ